MRLSTSSKRLRSPVGSGLGAEMRVLGISKNKFTIQSRRETKAARSLDARSLAVIEGEGIKEVPVAMIV